MLKELKQFWPLLEHVYKNQEERLHIIADEIMQLDDMIDVITIFYSLGRIISKVL